MRRPGRWFADRGGRELVRRRANTGFLGGGEVRSIGSGNVNRARADRARSPPRPSSCSTWDSRYGTREPRRPDLAGLTLCCLALEVSTVTEPWHSDQRARLVRSAPCGEGASSTSWVPPYCITARRCRLVVASPDEGVGRLRHRTKVPATASPDDGRGQLRHRTNPYVPAS